MIWCSPWQIDITDYLIDGGNDLEIHVSNSLVNRMIYDIRQPEENRVTYSYPVIVNETDKLVPSGLKGVKLIYR